MLKTVLVAFVLLGAVMTQEASASLRKEDMPLSNNILPKNEDDKSFKKQLPTSAKDSPSPMLKDNLPKDNKIAQTPKTQRPEEVAPPIYPVERNSTSPAQNTSSIIYSVAPSDVQVITQSNYTIQGNIKKVQTVKYYLKKQIVSKQIVIQKIDPTIPETFELEDSKPRATPFNDYISPNFTDWEGISAAIFKEINLARTQPQTYAKFIEQELNTFQGDNIFYSGPYAISTVEGQKAWKEAIEFLNKQPPVTALRRVNCLDEAAAGFVADSAKNTIIGHVDSFKRVPVDRIQRSCKIRSGGENIAYGFKSARGAVMQLLVDDGVADRGHRVNMFRNYSAVGVASGFYPDYGSITIHNFLA